ncbi:batten disease protein Cln3 [Peniophora sp. CONT]|nr:batten disease protein Cln3 [Peniophora sp. CONT]
MFRLGSSFFLFGLINNVLYVIVLSAALDLVPAYVPKGVVAFFNIAPAFAAKVLWPIFSKGNIRYSRRLFGCCAFSVTGMIIVAGFNYTAIRLLGIGLASFASGLGELTFLQLSTTYNPPVVAGLGLGYFSSGTGAAGLVGAFLWWNLRSLGVRVGVGISAILPLVIPLVYHLWVPRPEAFTMIDLPATYDDAGDLNISDDYAPLAASDEPAHFEAVQGFEEEGAAAPSRHPTALSVADKSRLFMPLVLKYMLPLFCVYMFEYTINQGIAPTLVYPVPDPDAYPYLKFIHSIRDYYPLWQLVYQAAVFISRSSISLGLPPLPARLLYLPAAIQAAILAILALESATGFIPDSSEGLAITLCFVLIAIEGFCGGSAYVNVFYRVNQERPAPGLPRERAKQEKEFQIGAIGLADSLGILSASLLAVPTEMGLCSAQVSRGKMFCKEL